MAIEIPAQIMRRVTDVDHTATIDLSLQAVHRSNWRLWCSERVVSDVPSLLSQFDIRPPWRFEIAGEINGTYEQSSDWSHEFKYSRSDDDCGASYDDIREFCAPEGFTLNANNFARITRVSANCNSQIADPQIAGPRCVTVQAHLGSCGYDNSMVAKHCKGRGFFEYDLSLHASNTSVTNMDAYPFHMESADGSQRSFSASHPAIANNLLSRKWRYSVVVKVFEGIMPGNIVSTGDGDANPDGVETRMTDGTLTINVKPE
jgi:hypothetical protein